MSNATRRHELILEMEKKRNSRLVTYFLSDRQGASAQIGEDAVRPMYQHLRDIGKCERLDLYLYSVGGATDVPWRIVSMIREFADELTVLVPYKAMSAATMISIGADSIVMGTKGELGPIDPQLQIARGADGGTVSQQQIAVEDIMAYVQFLKDRVGLSEQAALSNPIAVLAGKLDPWILGQINRAHSHIRIVARKLLMSRGKDHQLDEERVKLIIETLAEKTFQHGHAIGRREAREIGLNVIPAPDDLEQLMWSLFEEYEALSQLRDPFDARTFIPAGQEEHKSQVVLGCIESDGRADHFQADLKARNKRQVPPQLALTLNLQVGLPANVNPAALPTQMQQFIQQTLQQLQPHIQQAVQQEMLKQLPLLGIEGWLEKAAWKEAGEWPAKPTSRPGQGKK